jgi:hypothetical protein
MKALTIKKSRSNNRKPVSAPELWRCIYSIHCVNEGSPSIVSDVDCYVIIKNLNRYYFQHTSGIQMLWTFQTFLHTTFIRAFAYTGYYVPWFVKQTDYIFLNSFSLLASTDRVWTHTASYIMGTRNSSPLWQLPRREADHSSQTSDEVNNAWNYAFIPPHTFPKSVA